MAQLVGLIVSEDDAFKKQFGRLLRSGAIPVSVIDGAARDATPPDLVIVDARGDASSAMSSIERLRAGNPGAGIFAVALGADPDLILQSMRAGANEFFTWPPAEESLHGAIRRTAARRETAQGARPPATTLVFFGAKGGAGTTTVAVNCGVELARLSKRSTVIVDLKPGLGEVALFLGVRPRYSILDAIDNLHRLDREFLKELVVKHKSGLEILAGSDQFDRPGAADGGRARGAVAAARRASTNTSWSMPAARSIHARSRRSIPRIRCSWWRIPDVPSVRNAQRLLDRVRQLGACGERVRVLLNRAAEPYPIPPKQIEGALGHPIAPHVPE